MGQICQSCGMPLRQDPQGDGRNADGTKNTLYCSHCYADGGFLAPDVTAAEMQKVGIDALRKQGMARLIAWLMTRNVPRLSRWQTKPQ